MEQKSICRNCKHFMQHYIKGSTSYSRLLEGHCKNQEIPWKIRKHNISWDNCCEKWESNEEVKAEQKENIKTVLKNMRKTLINIEQILSDD